MARTQLALTRPYLNVNTNSCNRNHPPSVILKPPSVLRIPARSSESMELSAATIVTILSGLVIAFQPNGTRHEQEINICQDVQTKDGCVTSASLGQSIYFTCEDGIQTLYTCDGGCRQNNAANLPTCDFGALFNGTID